MVIQSKFKAVVGMVLSYAGLAWPKSLKANERRNWIDKMTVPYQPILSNGMAGPAEERPWTEAVDALYVFEGPEELEKLYSEDHLAFLSSLNGARKVIPR
jgi:hypothetical protein